MSYNTILFESSNKIATITLNRPDKMNAFSLEMLQELFDALEKVEKDNNTLSSLSTFSSASNSSWSISREKAFILSGLFKVIVAILFDDSNRMVL